MKVVILGKGEMLSNLIEGALAANCQVAGVFRYERTITHPFLLGLKDFFKSSPEVTLIKKYKCSSVTFTGIQRTKPLFTNNFT